MEHRNGWRATLLSLSVVIALSATGAETFRYHAYQAFFPYGPPASLSSGFDRSNVETQPPLGLRNALRHQQIFSYSNCDLGAFAQHEQSCESFYQCDSDGMYKEVACAPGLHWNAQKNICDWPANANCGSNFIDDGESDNDDFTVVGQKPSKPVKPVKPAGTQPAEPVKPEEPLTPGPSGTVRDTGKKVVCYFTNWAWYRPGQGKYTPDDIDPTLCTHINYGFAVLSGDGKIRAHDSWADFDNKFYDRVVALKSEKTKVLLALGGWNDSAGDKYSRMVNSPDARRRFVEHAVGFLEKYKFDGLDLDWEYPVCWQVNCKQGPASDKDGFSALVKELHQAFNSNGRSLMLTAAVSPSHKVIDKGYDVPVLNKYLDFINVMTYDYYGHWDKKTGHVAPLYNVPGALHKEFDANYTLHYWLEKGASKNKLIMGMPLYGQAFTMGHNRNRNKVPFIGEQSSKGQAGQFTRAAGFLAYYEICHNIQKNGWTVVRDDKVKTERMGPYAYSSTQWVGFDDSKMIRQKSEYVMQNGFGGAMVWALDLDDFKNRCGCEPHPLLRTINRVLRGYSVPDPKCEIKASPSRNQETPKIGQPIENNVISYQHPTYFYYPQVQQIPYALPQPYLYYQNVFYKK